MSRTITQRELRNDSGAVLRDVQAGQTIIVTRNGIAVAELRPVPPRRFVPRAIIADAARRAARVDAKRFRRDIDAVVDQSALYTRNPADFAGLEDIITVVAV